LLDHGISGIVAKVTYYINLTFMHEA